MKKRLATAVGLSLAALLAGCSSVTPTTAPTTSPGQFSTPPGGQRTGTVPAEVQGDQTFSLQAVSGDDGGIDFAAYDASMEFALAAVNEYWARTMPRKFGMEWIPPGEFIAYYPPEDSGPTCGTEQLGPENAVYCYDGQSDFIAWDEPGLMLPFYEEKGDMATAVVLAHEFGHGAQARLGLSDQFPLTIESELQADCFAGSWAAWADQRGLLGADAVDQAIDAVVSVADPEGVPWNAPDAHGLPEERLQAFADGADGGALACVDLYYPGFSQGG